MLTSSASGGGRRELDEAVERATSALRMLARAELLAGGFHQHKRQWRKRRGEGGGG